MRIRDPRWMGVLAALLAAVASRPAAGDLEFQRRGTFGIGGGVNIPVSEAADYLNIGGSFIAVAGRRLDEHRTIQVEWYYNWLTIDPELVRRAQAESLQVDNARGHNWSLTLNVVHRIRPEKDVVPWLTGGAGFYKRTLEITEVTAVYVPPIYDPWWGWIGGGWTEGESVIGSREASGFGFNVGGGIDFAIENDAFLFVEARYHYAKLDGVDLTMVPIMFGVRW